jgi:hypothetical protein
MQTTPAEQSEGPRSESDLLREILQIVRNMQTERLNALEISAQSNAMIRALAAATPLQHARDMPQLSGSLLDLPVAAILAQPFAVAAPTLGPGALSGGLSPASDRTSHAAGRFQDIHGRPQRLLGLWT